MGAGASRDAAARALRDRGFDVAFQFKALAMTRTASSSTEKATGGRVLIGAHRFVLASQSRLFRRLFETKPASTLLDGLPVYSVKQPKLDDEQTEGSTPAEPRIEGEQLGARDGGLQGFASLLQHYYSDMVAVKRGEENALRAFAKRASANHLIASLAAELAMMGYKPMLAEAEEQRAMEAGAEEGDVGAGEEGENDGDAPATDAAGSGNEEEHLVGGQTSDGSGHGGGLGDGSIELDEQDEAIELSARGGLDALAAPVAISS